jgi:hypothetical protein
MTAFMHTFATYTTALESAKNTRSKNTREFPKLDERSCMLLINETWDVKLENCKGERLAFSNINQVTICDRSERGE